MPYCPNPHDWSRYGLNQIAAMLRRHSPEAGPAAVTMWSAIETLCREQATRLRKALQDLEAQWPPTQEASLAFQEWGLTLVLAMENTAEVAHQNRSAAANISTEIERARARVETLMSEQARYQDLEQSGGTLLADAAYFGNELLEGHFDWRTWRAGLDRDARDIIADLEQKVYNYALAIYADPPYKPPVQIRREPPEPSGGGQPEGTAGAGWGNGGFSTSGGWSNRWTPPDGITLPGGGPNELPGETVLDGVGPGGGGVTASALPGAATAGEVFVDTPSGRVLAPGGVIGSPAAGGVGTTPGGPGSVTSPVTGGPTPTGSATRTPGGPGMVPFVPPVMPGRPASNTASTSSGRRSRPGMPSVFETPDGPPGIIQPPAEPTHHDPGPGVIGIDR
jgi:Histone deacetylase complex, SIN3 component